MKTPLLALMSLATLALAAPSRADHPPPDGQKYVGYAFKIQGLSAFPDHVVVAWPWSASNGVPTREFAVLSNDMPLQVGRRGPSIELFAVKKTTWETFLQNELGGAQPDNVAKAEALTAFLAPPNAVPCNAKPRPTFVLSSSDPRKTVEEVFTAKQLGDTTCMLERQASNEPVASGCSGCQGGGGELLLGLAGLAGLLGGCGCRGQLAGRRRS
jgi:hypothetical protein